MEEALRAAEVLPLELDYVNAHATATDIGDVFEADALRELVGDGVPVSSTKGHTGHTLAACGAMEVVFSLLMMGERFLAPTLNLDEVDPRCEGLRHIMSPREASLSLVMSSSFAFGGVNATLVLASREPRLAGSGPITQGMT